MSAALIESRPGIRRLAQAFEQFSKVLLSESDEKEEAIARAMQANAWFTRDNIEYAISSVASSLCEKNSIAWLSNYAELDTADLVTIRKTGLILAGNIPAVGFQDVLCVLASGNTALIKLSSQDSVLIPFLLHTLAGIEPLFKGRFEFMERLVGFDSIIATGSNNSSRYFEYYFSSVPHIIRKNRNSIAVLDGTETAAQLSALGDDIFRYFGLGCRNVSKLYVPENFQFDHFFEAIEHWKTVLDFHKYAHNYDYQLTIALINRLVHFTNGFVVLDESTSLHSPIASIHFERYHSLEVLAGRLQADEQLMQCICYHGRLPAGTGLKATVVMPGTSQKPAMQDYADGQDVMRFLLDLQSSSQ